jgi:predicted Rossmann fold flavoprotein
MQSYDVLVLGGGAAGLMCAITAGQRGRRVLVLEGSNRIGKKILMSGGGRCNFTNLHCEPANFLSANPRFCISALSRYTQWDFIALVEKHGIAYHEKSAGQLFCDESSKQIVAMLQAECDAAGVDIQTGCRIESVTHDDRFRVQCATETFDSESLVVATGGLSIPKMGASDLGYRLAKQFGLKVLPTRAGLVPFTFSGVMHEVAERLSGVSTAATLSCGSQAFTENILFTHRGLSGPAALQISSYWLPGDALGVDFLPGKDIAELLLGAKRRQPRSLLRSVLSEHLPRALVLEQQALNWPTFSETPMAEIPDDTLRAISQQLAHWALQPAATEGYRTAEVTLGGVDTAALSSKTMEVQQQPGLFFIGEVLDVSGQLGGFNFQWAWASGHAAGEVV